MEREIKFEYGFEGVNGIVKKVYHISEIPRISHKCDIWNVLPLCYVRQFTGLKDKNGKEIYEGDIIKYWGGIDPIVFDEGAYKIKHTGLDYFDLYESDDNEIIGNIHENKV